MLPGPDGLGGRAGRMPLEDDLFPRGKGLDGYFVGQLDVLQGVQLDPGTVGQDEALDSFPGLDVGDGYPGMIFSPVNKQVVFQKPPPLPSVMSMVIIYLSPPDSARLVPAIVSGRYNGRLRPCIR